LGKEVSLLDIYQLRDAITAKYGNAGFGLSKAILPEQRIEANGRVQIDIIEGFVDEVVIEGETNNQRPYLDYVAEKIKTNRPTNAKTLERYLLLINDRFAVKVTSTLKPSTKTASASTLILQVQPAPKLEGSIGVDNRGTKAVGPTQANVNLSINGLGGRASQTTLNYIATEQHNELQYILLSHTEVLNNEGTTLTASWNNTTSHPGTAALRALDNRSDSQSTSLKLAHPFIRTRQQNLTTHVKYEQKDVEGRSLGALTLQDKTRALRFGINYDHADQYDGINQAIAELSVGLTGMGGTPFNHALKSRADGKPDYQKLTLNLSRNQQLGYFSPSLGKFSINAALMGQYAHSGLLSSEECGIGGQQFGRGYDASEILGDTCLAASVELRYMPNVSGTPLQYAQFYGFYDGGTTRNNQILNATDTQNKSLASTGFGVRFGIGKYLTGAIEAVKPLTRPVANIGNNNPRLFANVSVRF
jgi:hemolysin activation/secretion protein